MRALKGLVVFLVIAAFFQPFLFPEQDTSSQEVEEFDFANGLFARGMYDMAIEGYTSFLQKHPKSAYAELARYRICESYFLGENYDKALSEFRTLLSQKPAKELALRAELRIGQIYYHLGDNKRSKEILSALADRTGAGDVQVGAGYYLAGVYFKEGDRLKAKAILEKLLAGHGESEYAPLGYINLGDIYFEDKDYLKAAKTYQKAMRAGSAERILQQAALRAGNAYFLAGDFKKAGEFYNKVIQETQEGTEAFDNAATRLISSIYRGGEYGEAAKLSEDLLPRVKGEDARAQIMFMRANSFFYANRFDEAEKIYRDITDKFPNTEIGLKSRLNSCWTLYRSENYKECLSRVDSYLKETNESRDEALYVKAKTLAKLGRGNEASNIYRLIIDKYRDSGFRKESLYEVGWLYDDTLGKPGEAVRYYIEFANDYQNDPRSAEMLLKAGQESFELKQYKNAETVYNLFLSRYPDSPLKENALYQLGAVYLGMGDYDNAVKAYEKFLVEFPGSTVRDSTIYWIARSYQGRQDWDKAVEYYSKLAGEKGGRFSDIATEAIGFCFFQKGDYDKAARVYKDLITGAKEYKLPSSVYRWVADYYLNGEEYDTSLLVLETYTKRYPGMGDNGEIFYLIAENYAGLENWREAAKNFRKALDGGVGSPYLERSYLGLGRSMAATGEHEEALEMLEMALSGHKDTLTGALARFEIGNVKNSLEDYEGAAKSFMMVAILYDDEDLVSRALFLAGMAFRKAGMPDKSKEAFEELIKKYPNSPLSVKAQAEIKKAESETR